jgi:hypothetical protein
MSVVKRSVSIDAAVAAAVEVAAAEDGISVSRWLTYAARRRLFLEREGAIPGRAQEFPPLTEAERAAGELLLDKLLAQTRGRDSDSPES